MIGFSLVASTRSATEFVVPAGLEVTLWAESPLFFNPTSMDVDYRGRIWIAEAVNYRAFRSPDRNQPEVVPFRHSEGDRIMILEDTDGDGVADSSKVFVRYVCSTDLAAASCCGRLGSLRSCQSRFVVVDSAKARHRHTRIHT